MKYLVIALLFLFSCDSITKDIEKQIFDEQVSDISRGFYAKDKAVNLCYYVQYAYGANVSMTCVPCDSIHGKVTYHLFDSNIR